MDIKISAGSSSYENLLKRQTPGSSSTWKNNKFYINTNIKSCDYWIVCHESGLLEEETVLCNPYNIIYISMEPNEDICRVNNLFLDQFFKVITCDEKREIKNKILMNVSTWWVGMKMKSINGLHVIDNNYTLDYDFLNNSRAASKLNRVSLIMSNKRNLKGHRQRLDAIEKLVSRPIGKYIDLFGTGFNPIQDKYDVIANYKYHLIFENELKENYWSEKLGDAFLGLSYPIYSGCTNITNFFNKESILEINRFDIDDMEKKLELALDSDYHKVNFDKILESKNLILNKYNLFNIITELCAEKCEGKKVPVTLLPNKYFSQTISKKIYWKYKSIFENLI